ncbi:MAG: lamin tail domain-containing protein [Coprobacillus sp.]
MNSKNKKRTLKAIHIAFSGLMVMSQMNIVNAAGLSSNIVINEIESGDADGGNDWVEIINKGSDDVNISNYFISDDQGLDRVTDATAWKIAEGTILKAGEVLVLEDSINFDFGLGKVDSVNLYSNTQTLLDTYSWTSQAQGTYGRLPNGTGTIQDLQPTKGTLNVEVFKEEQKDSSALVINEINSAPDDWVEVMNTSDSSLDISGYEIRDNSNDHRWRFPSGTTIEAGKLLLVKDVTVGEVYNDQTKQYVSGQFQEAIGIGSGDSIRLYDKTTKLIDEYTWTSHASYNGDDSLASYGRYPDGTGSFMLMKETPDTANDWYKPGIVINEVESDGDATDWIEVYNTSSDPIDISGWYMLDNDPIGHAADVTPVASGTILQPKAVYVFDQNKNFTFGLGKADSASIFTSGGALVDEYTWSSHATGVYARIPDGTGEFVDTANSTKDDLNIVTNKVVLNEIQSNDPDGKDDWIELANPTNQELDISGLVIKDSEDTHSYTIPTGTTIPANGYKVIYKSEFNFGLGKDDSVRLYENTNLIESATWTGDTNPTWGLYPDVNGKEYRSTKEATPGAANKFSDIPEVISWNGSQEVKTSDLTFLEDSSGLDFANGQLYAIDNGTGKFWILDVNKKDGSLSFAKGFENGKRIRFAKDAKNTSAAGPDTEGITVDGTGLVYAASERDNSAKGVNYNSILQVNPNTDGADLVALNEWDLTASLPQVSANMGIEAVEWVSSHDVNGQLFDQNTNKAFDIANYPNAIANGVFFVALEDNGHAYAYVLNNDGTSVQIADIDSKLGGAMSLDYDVANQVLWVKADDGYGNRSAMITLNATTTPDIVHVSPASSLDSKANNEGFAIISVDYAINNQRAVYHFQDGVKNGSLNIGSISADYLSKDSNDNTNNDDNESNDNINGDSNNNDNNKNDSNELPNQTTSPSNPKTDDSSYSGLYLGMILVSAVICIVNIVKSKFNLTK